MLEVFFKVITIFCMVAIGFAANKKNVLPMEANSYLVNLLLVITSPCMIIGSMASETLTQSTFRLLLEVLIGSAVFFCLAALVAFVLVKCLRCKDKEDEGVMMVIITSVNSGFMGFPVTKAIFGSTSFFLMVIENIVLNIYLYSLAVLQMNYGHEKKGNIKEVLKPLCNMCTLSLLFGLIILFAGIRLPEPVLNSFNTVGDATIPVSMIVVGVQLAENDLGRMVKNVRLIIASLANVLLMPALTFLLVNWLPLAAESKLVLVFAAAFPCAVVSVAVASKEGRNAGLMAEGVAMTTLFSMVTLPFIAVFLMTQYCCPS